MRKLSNGFLIFPHRGDPPSVEGYEPASDPYVLMPVMPECSYRGETIVRRQCCGDTERLTCELYGEFTTRQNCIACGGSAETRR